MTKKELFEEQYGKENITDLLEMFGLDESTSLFKYKFVLGYFKTYEELLDFFQYMQDKEKEDNKEIKNTFLVSYLHDRIRWYELNQQQQKEERMEIPIDIDNSSPEYEEEGFEEKLEAMEELIREMNENVIDSCTDINDVKHDFIQHESKLKDVLNASNETNQVIKELLNNKVKKARPAEYKQLQELAEKLKIQTSQPLREGREFHFTTWISKHNLYKPGFILLTFVVFALVGIILLQKIGVLT